MARRNKMDFNVSLKDIFHTINKVGTRKTVRDFVINIRDGSSNNLLVDLEILLFFWHSYTCVKRFSHIIFTTKLKLCEPSIMLNNVAVN